MRKICIVDTETTSLNPDTREAWDIAWQVYNPDTDEVEHTGQFFNDVDVVAADPMSLAMNHFWRRSPQSPQYKRLTVNVGDKNYVPIAESWVRLWKDTRDCTLAGLVPSFDEHTLRKHFMEHGMLPAWHYKLFDIGTWAAGVLGLLEASTEAVAAALNVPAVPEDLRHTAAGDVNLTLDILRAARARFGAMPGSTS